MVLYGYMHKVAAGRVALLACFSSAALFLCPYEATCTALSDMVSNGTLFIDRGR
jgi:hypothetical protein